jgi:predicted Zn-dependent protease
LAPDYGSAHARLSALSAERLIMLASPDPLLDQQRALDGARKAIELSGNDPYALMNAAQGLTICGDPHRARRMLARALKALPHDLLCWTFYWNNCATILPDGELPALIENILKTVSAHATHPLAAPMNGIAGSCYFRLGDLVRARAALQAADDDAPGFPMFALFLAAVHAAEGSVDKAGQVLTDIAKRGFRTDRAYMEALGRTAPSASAVAHAVAPFCRD